MKKMKRGRTNKNGPWPSDSLNGTNIAAYQGICLAAAEEGKKEGIYVTTESYCDERTGSIRRRNWLGSAIAVDADTAQKYRVYITFPDQSYGIATVPMLRARLEQYYISPYSNISGFVKYCLNKILNGPVGENMSRKEKNSCISKVCGHRQTLQRFKGILGDSFGNRKPAALAVYLRTLGYDYAVKSNSKKLTNDERDMRTSEREMVFSKCYRSNESTNSIDSMFWRLASWGDVCKNNTIREPNTITTTENETEHDEEVIVNHLFSNEAGRKAFRHYQGSILSGKSSSPSNEVSILSLARADACFTTMFKWLTVQGKGGSRNTAYNDFYNKLVPKAMENIIQELWDDLSNMVAHELRTNLENNCDDPKDVYGNNKREWTVVLEHPEDNHIYLLASPKYIREKVCSWIGNVRDAFIGRRRDTESIFTMIQSEMIFDDHEESDLEEEFYDSAPSNRSLDEDVEASSGSNVDPSC